MRNISCRSGFAMVAAASLLLAGCGSGGGGSANSSEAQSPSGSASSGFDAENYFKGKTLRVIVSSTAGGNTDIFTRFIASKLGDEIPGKPRVAVTNESGLGGIGHAYDAPEDELVIGAASRSSLLYGTATDPAAKQDPEKIQVIGGIAGDPRAWAAFGSLINAYPSLADAINKPDGEKLRFAATVGGPGEVESDAFLFTWMCENLKLPCEYVNVADDSSADTNLMVQRGEVNLQGGTMITFMRQYLQDLQDGKAKFLMQYAPTDTAPPPLPDGITAQDITTIIPPDKLADFDKIAPIISSGQLGNMLWAGPAMPADAVNALSDAYGKVVANEDNVKQLASLMAGGDSPYQYKVTPLAGEDAVKAWKASSGAYETNKDFIEGLREQYAQLWQ
jgi:tripartite-type tricarboxylate transporter receptor subunit TctC